MPLKRFKSGNENIKEGGVLSVEERIPDSTLRIRGYKGNQLVGGPVSEVGVMDIANWVDQGEVVDGTGQFTDTVGSTDEGQLVEMFEFLLQGAQPGDIDSIEVELEYLHKYRYKSSEDDVSRGEHQINRKFYWLWDVKFDNNGEPSTEFKSGSSKKIKGGGN